MRLFRQLFSTVPAITFVGAALAATLLLAVLNLGATANAQQASVTISDGTNSSAAARLLDGDLGTTAAAGWENASNRWSQSAYPMTAVLDLGSTRPVDGVRFYAGQIPFPSQARIDFAISDTGDEGDFTPITYAENPVYDAWSPPVDFGGASGRYIELRFSSVESHFTISEIEVLDNDDGPSQPTKLPIAGVRALDGSNSERAGVLVDEQVGSDPSRSWWNPNIWSASAYPMTVELDLGGTYELTDIEYFVGNLNQGSDELVIGTALTPTGQQTELGRSVGHDWNDWHTVEVGGVTAQRVELKFESMAARFNISEVRLYGMQVDAPATPTPILEATATPTPTPTAPTPTATPSSPDPTPTPAADPTATPTPTPTAPTPTATPAADPTATPTPSPTPTPTPTPGEPNDQPRTGPPPSDVVRAYGFGIWPSDHLSETCRTRHDSYWVQGPGADPTLGPDHPNNIAYHTWHPALDVLDDGTTCDYGHEHGTNPEAAGEAAFDLSGGWPAFGYTAEQAALNHQGMDRHEDHVGHKITVATFRAAIGNGANRNDTLYDAGFECTWLSKIHQGSYSMDAFSNHLHEYFLTLICGDGTEFSVKVMYTYGEANTFVEDNCSQNVDWTPGDDITFDSSILTGPDGSPVPPAHRTQPVGNNGPNHRAFTCASGVLWQDMETEVGWVDIWNELIKIQHGDGSTALTIQPYYIVKNPARIIEPYDGIKKNEGEDQDFELPTQVVHTISLCYGDDGQRLGYDYCNDAPASEPDWRDPSSPFNGTFRAVHFKSSDLQNGGRAEVFCTDAFGHAVNDELPCDPGNIEQRAASFTNHWNDGEFSHAGQSGNIHGSIWSRTPHGAYIEAEPRPGGGFRGYVLGHELVIDNRFPDDDFDGVPDGANIRGEN